MQSAQLGRRCREGDSDGLSICVDVRDRHSPAHGDTSAGDVLRQNNVEVECEAELADGREQHPRDAAAQRRTLDDEPVS